MIDVHVIKSGRPYIQECLESLKNSPITIHTLDYNENYGKVRIDGFSMGNSPYVAHVDDDDIIVDGVFERALNVLEKGYSAYYSNHYVADQNLKPYGKWFDKVVEPIGFAQALQMHHVVVYRRSIITPVLPYLNNIKTRDKLLLNLKSIYDGKVYGDEFMGAYWRVHDDSMHNKFTQDQNPQQWHDQVNWYKTELLKRAKYDNNNKAK